MVSNQLSFRKRFDFSQLPNDWRVLRVTVDWNGKPLVLCEEGKPQYPGDDATTEVRIAWDNAPPKAHHLVHWDGVSPRMVTLEQSTGILSFHVQPFDEGWLLGDIRGGRAAVYDRSGRYQRSLNVGDASNDLQTTPGGKIWVSYFDEGVYGSGVGSQQGVVCFDSSGRPIFKYFDFAEQNGLPFIDDCYAMNVVNEDEVWLSYYSDFPLVCIKSFQRHRVWKGIGCIARAFGLLGTAVIFQKCYTRVRREPSQLALGTLTDPPQITSLSAMGDDGTTIDVPFQSAARGSHFFLWTDTTLYELTSTPDKSASRP